MGSLRDYHETLLESAITPPPDEDAAEVRAKVREAATGDEDERVLLSMLGLLDGGE